MGEFKCYNANLKSNVLSYCTKQCMECERKELLEKSDLGSIPKERTGIPFPSQQRAKEQRDKLYTRDQMFLFAGFCMARKKMDPGKDVGEILNEFNATFGNG